MNSSTVRGHKGKGRSWFIFRKPVVSTAPFSRLSNADHANYFYTTNETETDDLVRRGGYVNRGYVGYIYTSVAAVWRHAILSSLRCQSFL